MIHVRMRKNNTIDQTRVEGKATITVAGLSSATLKESAIEQNAAITLPQFMHGSSHSACGAPEINLHS